jgi:hypothetical protein
MPSGSIKLLTVFDIDIRQKHRGHDTAVLLWTPPSSLLPTSEGVA